VPPVVDTFLLQFLAAKAFKFIAIKSLLGSTIDIRYLCAVAHYRQQ